MVDEETQKKFSFFYTTKNEMVEPRCKIFHRQKLGSNKVVTFRHNNARENKKLDKRINSKDWMLNVKFEHTLRDTPQHVYLAEVRFTTWYRKVTVLMFDTNLPIKITHVLLAEVFQTKKNR